MISIDAERLTKSERAPVWGPIWFECPELEAFPELGWYDVLTPILAAWINALVGFAQRDKGMTTVQFMDGPFRVMLKLNGPDVCIELLRTSGDTSKAAIKGHFKSRHFRAARVTRFIPCREDLRQ